jgi:hypothetical protein
MLTTQTADHVAGSWERLGTRWARAALLSFATAVALTGAPREAVCQSGCGGSCSSSADCDSGCVCANQGFNAPGARGVCTKSSY